MEQEGRWSSGDYRGYWSSWTCRPGPITTFPSLIGGCHGCGALAWQYGVGGAAKATAFSLPGYSGFLRQAGPGYGLSVTAQLPVGTPPAAGRPEAAARGPGCVCAGMACMAQAEGIWLLKGQTWGS